MTLPPTPSLPPAVSSGHAPVNGISIWYATFGSGPPVVLLHGGLANSNYWGNQVPVLAKTHRVIVMDSRGMAEPKPDAEKNIAVQLLRLVAPMEVAVEIEERHVVVDDRGAHRCLPARNRLTTSP